MLLPFSQLDAYTHAYLAIAVFDNAATAQGCANGGGLGDGSARELQASQAAAHAVRTYHDMFTLA